MTTCQELKVLRGYFTFPISGSFSPCGSMVASACDDQTVQIWDSTTGVLMKILGPLDTSLDHPRISTSFASDGLKIFASTDDGRQFIWDSMTYRQIPPHPKHDPSVSRSMNRTNSETGFFVPSPFFRDERSNLVSIRAESGRCLLILPHALGSNLRIGCSKVSPDNKSLSFYHDNGKVIILRINNNVF